MSVFYRVKYTRKIGQIEPDRLYGLSAGSHDHVPHAHMIVSYDQAGEYPPTRFMCGSIADVKDVLNGWYRFAPDQIRGLLGEILPVGSVRRIDRLIDDGLTVIEIFSILPVGDYIAYELSDFEWQAYRAGLEIGY